MMALQRASSSASASAGSGGLSARAAAKAAKAERYEAFNRSVKAFLRDMADTYPGRFRQLRLVKAAYKTLKGLNRRWPRKVFFETVEAPYGAQIRARDDAFFLRPEFSIPMFEDFIESIKEDWRGLDAEMRAAVWRHMHCMLDCSQACGPLLPTDEAGGDE